MKYDLLIFSILFLSVLFQETLMPYLLINYELFGFSLVFEGDLALAVLIGLAFFVPPHQLDIFAFSSGLFRSFASLAVTDSLGYYPLIYLCTALVVSRYLVPFLPRTVRHRLPFVALTLVMVLLLQNVLWLLLEPSRIHFSWSQLLNGMGSYIYTILIWFVLAFVLFHPLEKKEGQNEHH